MNTLLTKAKLANKKNSPEGGDSKSLDFFGGLGPAEADPPPKDDDGFARGLKKCMLPS